MKYSILLIPLLGLVSCGTRYAEFDPQTGMKTIAFSTHGNIGFTTSKNTGSNSSTGGIPLLNGGFANNDQTVAVENTGSVSGLKVGQLEINGTVDHSTMVDVGGGWLWRTIRTVVTGKVFSDGIEAIRADRLATHSADVALAKTASSENVAIAREATKVSTQKIASDTAVALKP